MSKKVKYSVVVAVYNRPEEMIELLKSIADQTFRDFEIIIVDDGSDRSSRLAFQKYKSQLNLSYFFTENQGPALARNFGVKKSEGEWIIFFDSDCSIPNNYFFEVEKFLVDNDVSLYGGPDMMDESFTYLQKSINFSMTSLFTTGGIRGNKISIDKFLPRSFNMGIKREAFDEVNGFSNIRQYGEDLDLSYKLIFSGNTSLESEVLISINGWWTNAYRFSGAGNFETLKSSWLFTKIRPPCKAEATLSAGADLLDINSPFIANWIRSSNFIGSPNNLLIPNTEPTALDALLPIPLPGLIFLLISISNPPSISK